MSVLVRFDTGKAILRSGEWRSADKGLERDLNDATTRWIQETGGPTLSDRDQERTVAREMARRFSGTVGLHLKSRTGEATRSFLERRQMTLDFPSYSPANSRRTQRPSSTK